MTYEETLFGLWRPWQPEEASRFFSRLSAPWWIAGGWALDLFLGVQTREHEDIDVQILRRDQQEVRALFNGWDIQEADPGTLPASWPFREWEAGQMLSPHVHDIWCRPSKTEPWVVQLMVVDVIDERWLFRRDPRISGLLTDIGRQTSDGIPYIAPEFQLLYKARALRPKDEADFARTLPALDGQRRQWLARALALIHPGHAWLAELI